MDLSAVVGQIPAQYLTLVLSLMGLASFLDTVVPQVQPGSRWRYLRAALHLAGQNYGQARKALGR